MQNTTSVPNHIEWTGCTGSDVILDGANAVWKGNTPPGWGQNPTSPLQGMVSAAWKCDRISWGSFERGPIYMMQEWQTNFDDPVSCQQNGTYQNRWVMESIWFSDPDVAAYAHQVYGLTTYAANFTFQQTPTVPGGPTDTWAWTWTPKEGSESTFTLHYDEPPLSQGKTIDRIFWYNGQGISYMDLTSNYKKGAAYDPAQGNFPAPMMWGQYGPTSQFVEAQAFAEIDGSLSASIARFGDMGCTKPL